MKRTVDFDLTVFDEYGMDEWVEERLEESDFFEDLFAGYLLAADIIDRVFKMQQICNIGVAVFEADAGVQEQATLNYLKEYTSEGGVKSFIEHNKIYIIAEPSV